MPACGLMVGRLEDIPETAHHDAIDPATGAIRGSAPAGRPARGRRLSTRQAARLTSAARHSRSSELLTLRSESNQ